MHVKICTSSFFSRFSYISVLCSVAMQFFRLLHGLATLPLVSDQSLHLLFPASSPGTVLTCPIIFLQALLPAQELYMRVNPGILYIMILMHWLVESYDIDRHLVV